ncbi:protein-disulfide reductase [Ranunculus cassubicifolius]
MATGDHHDLKALLSSSTRDFLVRNNGDQVKISELEGKTIGLYFSASWCPPCRRFTPQFIDVYNELSSEKDFEVIFVSRDRDEESFNAYFSKMPWLAIPFSDSDTLKSLINSFVKKGIPCLPIISAGGLVLIDNAVKDITAYGAEAYPFTPERKIELKEIQEIAKKEQTLRSVLVSNSRDVLITNDGNRVPVTDLEGNIVGLLFHSSAFAPSVEFTQKLIDVYNKLNDSGEIFKVVVITFDEDEETFEKSFKGMPWLAVPCNDKMNLNKLLAYFELSRLPTLVILGADGKTLVLNAAELVEDFGVQAYPFSSEKLAALEEITKARLEAQTLESIFVKGDKDFVIAKDGSKQVPVSDLVGKNILLYFSAQWCPPCRTFLPKLIQAYHQIKEKHEAFEVIFISSDRDESSFEKFFSEMPWLALPFGDERKASLSKTFKISSIPTVVALGPSGKTLTTGCKDVIAMHGGKAYPFDDERVKELDAEIEETAKGWPAKVKHALHEKHELVLTRHVGYVCDGCQESGGGWSFYCKACDFDLHPKCALPPKEEARGDEKTDENTSDDAS